MIPEDIPAFKTRLDHSFLAFFAAWIGWSFAAHFLLYRKRPVEFRRRWHPIACVISGLSFLAFVAYIVSIGFPSNALYTFGPAVVVLTALNIRNTRFCDACGGQSFNLVKRPIRCRRCGKAL